MKKPIPVIAFLALFGCATIHAPAQTLPNVGDRIVDSLTAFGLTKTAISKDSLAGRTLRVGGNNAVAGGAGIYSLPIFTDGAGHVTGLRSNPSFTGANKSVTSGAHLSVTNSDGSSDTTAGLYIGPVDAGANATYSLYAPGSAPSYLGGDLTVTGAATIDSAAAGAFTVEKILGTGIGSAVEVTAVSGAGGADRHVGIDITVASDIGNADTTIGLRVRSQFASGHVRAIQAFGDVEITGTATADSLSADVANAGTLRVTDKITMGNATYTDTGIVSSTIAGSYSITPGTAGTVYISALPGNGQALVSDSINTRALVVNGTVSVDSLKAGSPASYITNERAAFVPNELGQALNIWADSVKTNVPLFAPTLTVTGKGGLNMASNKIWFSGYSGSWYIGQHNADEFWFSLTGGDPNFDSAIGFSNNGDGYVVGRFPVLELKRQDGQANVTGAVLDELNINGTAIPFYDTTITMTATGFSGTVTSNVSFARVGRQVCIGIGPFSGTSNSTGMTLVGPIPSWALPAANSIIFSAMRGIDNFGGALLTARLVLPNTISFTIGAGNTFTASGTKGVGGTTSEWFLPQFSTYLAPQ